MDANKRNSGDKPYLPMVVVLDLNVMGPDCPSDSDIDGYVANERGHTYDFLGHPTGLINKHYECGYDDRRLRPKWEKGGKKSCSSV